MTKKPQMTLWDLKWGELVGPDEKKLIHYINFVRGYYTQFEIDGLRLLAGLGFNRERAAGFVYDALQSGITGESFFRLVQRMGELSPMPTQYTQYTQYYAQSMFGVVNDPNVRIKWTGGFS
jgi:hypothetical protein